MRRMGILECIRDVSRRCGSMDPEFNATTVELHHGGVRTRISFKRVRNTRFRAGVIHCVVLVVVSLVLSNNTGLAYFHENFGVMRRRLSSRNMYRSIELKKSSLDSRMVSSDETEGDNDDENSRLSRLERKMMKRIIRLEEIVSRQEVEIDRLKRLCNDLTETSKAFIKVVQLLQEAGLEDDSFVENQVSRSEQSKENKKDENYSDAKQTESPTKNSDRITESFDDSIVFGTAPTSVIDAADSAGAAILAGMLGGKQRMLVDVRDAELSTDSDTLVQFIELAILPVAAGLEGLKSTRNRVKIVFPKVSQLLQYRRTMALAAPEVVALSTLGFDPVEKRDKLVVIVAPSPDDEEGLTAMSELLSPTDTNRKPIQQPIVILNYHMLPVAELPSDFETAYHLRLLTVQYMSGGDANEYFQQFQNNTEGSEEPVEDSPSETKDDAVEVNDEILEAAMKHAQEVGMNQGTTRAMVIRAYPRPWHVFVDTSPDTDADFEVAATFDEEPSLDQLNAAIVECLEGSELEEEIVAQQMQQALEEGQLDKVSDMIGKALEEYDETIEGSEDDDDADDEEADDFDMFEEDSV